MSVWSVMSGIEPIISLVMLAAVWLLVALAVTARITLKNRLLVPAAGCFAIAMTLVQDGPYRLMESWTGQQNLTVALFQGFCILAIVFLSWIGFAAIGDWPMLRAYRWTTLGVGIGGIALLLLLFAPGAWPAQDQFMVPYLADWRAAAYSSVQWLAMGWMAWLGWTAVRIDSRRTGSLGGKATVTLIGAGCLFAFAAIVAHVGLIVWKASGAPDGGLEELVLAQLLTQDLSAIFIAAGLAVAPGRAVALYIRSSVTDRALLWRSFPLWLQLGIRDDPMCMDADATRLSDLFGSSPRARLWRRWVEIQDHVIMRQVPLGERDQRMLKLIEQRMEFAHVAV